MKKFFAFLTSKISFFLAIIGLIAAVVLIKILNTPDPTPKTTGLPAVNPFENAISGSGIIEALDRNISIGSPVSGVVEKLYVGVGDRVKKDGDLFKIDDRELQAQLIVQKADVIVAKANVKRLQDQLERLKSVSDPRAVSVDEVKTKHNDVAISIAQYTAARAKVKQTELLIERHTVKAPKDGTVLQTNLREGEYVSSTDPSSRILFGDLSLLQIRADIDEQNAARFNPKQRAYAYPKNNTTFKIPLTFERIEPYVTPKKSLTGSSDERVDTRVLQVLYTFEEPKDFNVYVGQQVDVFINTNKTTE